jgi:hypothetical protein
VPEKQEPSAGRRSRLVPSIARGLFLIAALALPALRAAGVIDTSWTLVLAPFTVAGVLFVGVALWMLARPKLDALRGTFGAFGEATLTPAPDHLEPALGAEDAGERILVQHPELLAALCHGFRMMKLQPIVLGKPVTDPWGVYAATLLASSLELEQVRLLARRHTQRYAALGRKELRRTPSDAQVMKRAVQHFHRCAAKSGKRGNPDCPFEHVTVIFGTRSPNRDAHLKAIAPKVRALLERQYPQLATARLADGSTVEFSKWQKQAMQDRKELARLGKEHERTTHRLEAALADFAEAQKREDRLNAKMEALRTDARAAAREEQAKHVGDLQSALERGRLEHMRELERAEGEKAQLLATIETLSNERDALERALFAEPEGDDTAGQESTTALSGMRVLLVGGSERQVPPIREYLESRGVQLLHQDGPAAAELVGGVHIVVLWIRYMSHPTAFALKRECRIRGVPVVYWTRTSPISLVALVASAQASAALETANGMKT